jgi:hypothetical protein
MSEDVRSARKSWLERALGFAEFHVGYSILMPIQTPLGLFVGMSFRSCSSLASAGARSDHLEVAVDGAAVVGAGADVVQDVRVRRAAGGRAGRRIVPQVAVLAAVVGPRPFHLRPPDCIFSLRPTDTREVANTPRTALSRNIAHLVFLSRTTIEINEFLLFEEG